MTSAADIVREFFERMESRSWDSAGELLSSSVHIEFTATGEVFDGESFLAMNRAYPEGWSIEVTEIVAEDDRVAAQVSVHLGDERFWCAGFYQIADGLIASGVEHWVTERSEPPPVWRREFVT